MASSSTDTHEFIKQIMLDWFNKETIESDEVDSAMRQVESVLVCDSRNLYDALAKIESSGLHLEEKRIAIEVLSIRERTKAAGMMLRWVASRALGGTPRTPARQDICLACGVRRAVTHQDTTLQLMEIRLPRLDDVLNIHGQPV